MERFVEQKKQFDLKIEKNVKVKVSKNGKWITHILPGQGVMVTFSMKYYRTIVHAYPETETFNQEVAGLDTNKLSLLIDSNEKINKEE